MDNRDGHLLKSNHMNVQVCVISMCVFCRVAMHHSDTIQERQTQWIRVKYFLNFNKCIQLDFIWHSILSGTVNLPQIHTQQSRILFIFHMNMAHISIKIAKHTVTKPKKLHTEKCEASVRRIYRAKHKRR